MDIRVSREPVVQGSFRHFKEPFFMRGASVYFAGPEPLPLAFFADERGLATRLAELDHGDFDLPCFCDCCFRFVCSLARFCGDLDFFRGLRCCCC